MAFYHLSMLLPALCIGAAVLILWAAGRGRGRGGWFVRGAGSLAGDRTTVIAVLAIGLAGLSTTGVIVHFDVQSPEWEAASFLLRNYPDEPDTVKAVSPTSHWPLSDVYGLQNTTDSIHRKAHLRGVLDVSDLAVQDATGFSDHYVQPDAERIILVLKNNHKKYFADVMEACDYATDSANMRCHTVYSAMRIYNDGVLVKEFQNGAPVDAFPPLPPNIERYLINSYEVVEWVPAK